MYRCTSTDGVPEPIVATIAALYNAVYKVVEQAGTSNLAPRQRSIAARFDRPLFHH